MSKSRRPHKLIGKRPDTTRPSKRLAKTERLMIVNRYIRRKWREQGLLQPKPMSEWGWETPSGERGFTLAHTKSEARSHIKADLQQPRVPIGTRIVKVTNLI